MSGEAVKGIYRIVVRLEFSASHRLENYKGKCEALHGHNFGVEVEAEGERPDEASGMLMDFGDLKREAREVVERLDHKHLNDLEQFSHGNPTSENIARWIFEELRERVASYGVRMRRVTVSEKSAQSASYLEE